MEEATARRHLDFQAQRERFVRFLDNRENRTMVLATSCDNRVTARYVLVASQGLDMYFFTWGHSRKCDQIRKNPRVALCTGQVQVEGTAEILGGLTDEVTKESAAILINQYPEAVARWQDRPNMVIIRVRPTFAMTGASSTDERSLDYLDLENEVAYSESWASY